MDIAHAKARAFVDAGDFAAADPWFLNALARNPGDVSILRDFASAMARTGDAEQLRWLETFLGDRVAHVEPGLVDEVLGLIAETRARRDALPTPPPEPVVDDTPEDPFELAERPFRELLDKAEAADDPRVASHLLQAADGFARQLVMADPARASSVLDALDRVANNRVEQQHLAQWTAFDADHRLRDWTAPGGWKGKKGACQRRLEELGAMQRALATKAAMWTGAGRERADERLREIEGLAGDAAEAQQRRYELWAMARIRKGLEKGKEAMGVIDDESAIADALVEELGQVDTRFLGQAAGRAWTEVFELLYGRLDKVSGPKDFDDKKTKLSALERLAKTTKRTPAEW